MSDADHIMPPLQDTGPLETMARAMIDVPGDIVSMSLSGNPHDWAMARQRMAAAAISALTEAGYAIVPTQPSDLMLAAGQLEAEGCTNDWTASAACLSGHVWSAMLAATPLNIKEGE